MKNLLLKKVLAMSRYVFFGIMLQMICFSLLLAASESSAQQKSINEIYLSISAEDAQLQEVFKKIERASGLRFAYNHENLKQSSKINLQVNDESLAKILESISRQARLKFKRINENIHVSKLKSGDSNAIDEVISFKQTKNVSGKVTAMEDGEGIPGVNVLEKGTNNGTVTDINGDYSLEVSENTTLVFSSVGYTTEEIVIGNQSVIDVSLTQNIQELQELVVVGYGEQKRSDLTGSVASANVDAFREAPNVNIMQSLQGSVPGVQIGQVTTAGEEPNISIRGQTTLDGNNDPLIVVDGIIYRGRIGDLNPADIQSVDVLKDASSMAIYGAQAANGVIMITSKKGTAAKKPTITYAGSFATQTPNQDIRLLNREEYLQAVKDTRYEDAFLAPDYTEPNPAFGFDNSDLLPRVQDGIPAGTNFDWWDESTSPGYLTDHRISLSGGSESTTYYISGGYTDQQGYIKNDEYTRTSIRINLQTDVTDWLTVGTNTFGAFADFSGVFPDMQALSRTSPLVTPYTEDGEFVINHLGDNIVNPFLNSAADDFDRNNNISGNFFAIVDLPWIKGLSYRLNYNNSFRWFQRYNSNRYAENQAGRAYKNTASNNDVLLDNIVNYERKFGKHTIKATLVAGFNTIKNERTQANGVNIPNLSLSYDNLSLAGIQTISSEAWTENYIYQMARINYNFENRYLFTATLRRDGFSGFSKNNKVALFPSIGAGWVLSEEGFFNVPFVDFLKVRGSYGENGNLTPRYSSLARVVADDDDNARYVFGDGGSTVQGFSVASLANNDLSWEITRGFNFGLDFELLNSRLNGSIDYYANTTFDLLWQQVLPEISGFNTIRTNLGEIDNRGLEIALNTNPVNTGDFRWDVGFNFATNNNKVVSLLGQDNNGDGVEDDLIGEGLFIGKSINTIYSYQIDGIWQLDDEIPDGYSAGTYRIVDQNDDGEINPADDRIFLGREEPAYSFGIQNTLKYKEFTFRFFINSIQGGNDGYLGLNHPRRIATSLGTAQNWNWFNNWEYWSPSNPDALFPQPWIGARVEPNRYMSRSFVRLQDISLAYDLPSTLTNNIGLNSAKVYISGKNLLTFTDWLGWDPETGDGIGNDQGFPVMRAYTVGLDISF